MASQDGEGITDQHLSEGTKDVPAQNIDEENQNEINASQNPLQRKASQTGRKLRSRFKTKTSKVTKYDILKKIKVNPQELRTLGQS
jgi:hypothetical protein